MLWLINPYYEMIVCAILSFFAAYKIAMVNEKRHKCLYSSIYLGFVFLWHSFFYYIGFGLRSVLTRIDTVPFWKKIIGLPAWVCVFAVLLFIQVIIRNSLKKWIKVNSLIYIPIFFVLIKGFIELMKKYMFYFFITLG